MNQVNTMFVPDYINRDYYQVAIKVACTLKISLTKITGHGDNDEKILTCYLEMLYADSTSPFRLAKKYNINVDYMMKRIGELGKRFKTESELKEKFKSLLEAFDIG